MKTKKQATKKVKGFSDAERAAMKERFDELNMDKNDAEAAVLAKIEAMPEPDRALAKRIHKLVMKSAPGIKTKTWYGMPSYSRNGQVIFYFQNASRFKARYATIGFSDKANLDGGNMWPVAYALAKLTPNEEKKIVALVKKAVS